MKNILLIKLNSNCILEKSKVKFLTNQNYHTILECTAIQEHNRYQQHHIYVINEQSVENVGKYLKMQISMTRAWSII